MYIKKTPVFHGMYSVQSVGRNIYSIYGNPDVVLRCGSKWRDSASRICLGSVLGPRLGEIFIYLVCFFTYER